MSLEEADQILFAALIDVGFCPDEATSVGGLSTEDVYRAAALCIKTILPERTSDLPTRLSISLTSKLAHCSLLAGLCQEIGFRGDIGYQTFLYGSVKEVRGVLSFLVDKLPREVSLKPLGPRERLLASFASLVQEELLSPWVPFYCQPLDQSTHFITETISSDSVKYVTKQPSRARLVLPSILAWTTRLQLAGCGDDAAVPSVRPPVPAKPPSIRQYQQQMRELASPSRELGDSPTVSGSSVDGDSTCSVAVDATAAPLAAPTDTATDRQLTELRDQLATARRRLQRGRQRCEKLQRSVAQVSSQRAELESSVSATRSDLDRHRYAFSRLSQRPPSPAGDPLSSPAEDRPSSPAEDRSPSSAEEPLSRARQRYERHQRDWLTQRHQLQERLEQLQLAAAQSPVHQLRARGQQISVLLATRRSELQLLQRQQAALTGQHAKRSSYTKRILEINGNVKKQRQAMLETIDEMRCLRQSINSASAKVSRAFDAAEDMIFQDVQDSEWARAVYKALVNLHETSGELVEIAQETGAIIRQSQRLEDAITVESSKSVQQSLVQVTRDLEAVVEDNSRLQSQLTPLN